jgi:hypothetical protein
MHINSTKGVWSINLLQLVKFHINNHKHLEATINVKQ